MNIKLSERLKKLRKDEKISQAKLAEIIGVDKAMFGHVESGKSLVSIQVLMLLADFFKVTTDYLLGRSDKKN